MSERPVGSVLFACSLNTVRSPMAAALAGNLRPDLYIASAGVQRGAVDGFATSAIEERGLSLANHEPHTINELGDMSFDLVVTLSEPAREAVERMARTFDISHEHWPIEDPTDVQGHREQRLIAYRAVRDELERRVATRFAKP